MSDTWRDQAAPIIAEVIDRVGRDDMQRLRRELRKAYPFGERRYWPYKVWCNEVRRQLGIEKGAISRKHQEVRELASGQKHLF